MIPIYNYVPINISDGSVSVSTAGTRVQLSTANIACINVSITANSSNTGIICAGGSTIVATSSGRTGLPLSAGDTVVIEIVNLNKIYIDSTVNSEGVSYYYKN